MADERSRPRWSRFRRPTNPRRRKPRASARPRPRPKKPSPSRLLTFFRASVFEQEVAGKSDRRVDLGCCLAAAVAVIRCPCARTLAAAGTTNRRRLRVGCAADDLCAMAAALRADMRRSHSAMMGRVVVNHAPRHRNRTAKPDEPGNPLNSRCLSGSQTKAYKGRVFQGATRITPVVVKNLASFVSLRRRVESPSSAGG